MFTNLTNKKIFRDILIFVLALIMGFVFSPNSVKAKEQDSRYFDTKITPEEQAIFAFFRAADVMPEYESWISSSSKYKSLPDNKKEDYLVKEMLRLGRGYGLYDQDTDVLELFAPVVVKYYPAKNEGEKPHLKFRFLDVGQTDVPTFDFSFGQDIVSLAVENLNVFSNLPLSPEQNQAVLTKIPYEGDEFDADLIVHTKVYKADFKNPVGEHEQSKRWLMIGKIAYVKCSVDSFYTHQTHTLWDYVAPWYEEQFRIKNMPEEEKYPHPYDLFK